MNVVIEAVLREHHHAKDLTGAVELACTAGLVEIICDRHVGPRLVLTVDAETMHRH